MDQVSENILFVMISEAWWYEQPATDPTKILPKDHPNKVEGIMAKISFEDKEITQMIAYLRGISRIAFEPVVEMDMDATVSGRFAKLFTNE